MAEYYKYIYYVFYIINGKKIRRNKFLIIKIVYIIKFYIFYLNIPYI